MSEPASPREAEAVEIFVEHGRRLERQHLANYLEAIARRLRDGSYLTSSTAKDGTP